MARVVIVGAGQAGASVAMALRQEGFPGAILVLGAEPDLPYERPPLSKQYLAGELEAARLLLRPPAFWAERTIDIRTGCQVVEVDPARATVRTRTGETLAYDTLVWAAGGTPRRLPIPGGELAHVIRTRADVDRIRAALPDARRVVIAGGGWIGLEVAAVLVKRGLEVTVVEAMDRLLARVTAPPLSAFMADEHRRQGVEILLGDQIAAIEGDGRARAVVLASGARRAADLVIAGVGLVPEVGPLSAAGAACPDGVAVDAHGRTGLPRIWAAGDCARHPNPFAGGRPVRLESVQNAADMGKAVAASIVRGLAAPPYHVVPWFWSNQYDLKLQTVGLTQGADSWVVRGDPASRSWSLVHLRAGAVVALDCINAPRDYVQGRALVERGARIAPHRLADASVPLKELGDER
ncbi:MAG: FAD-dependent oxidoreductase [Sphingomonadaceae bacterium]|uniref:NAD(P)/FAD-dependent oxidoreductase n=1 Tax=Thermaurantiacus sp. TaxID=2820283 RepID=UPI00298EF0A0|nr:FAD-dependent oxidoreductase [Thermaurantiacus sp.]MCS6986392.1 FAD-dependent oxidoreductase [Sphingomonadaceae bacterium]MDW8414346.1 FAD-dependent oxidoreductase [Thermaurantiacus sp.]